MKMAKFFSVMKSLQIDLGGFNEKMSGQSKPEDDIMKAESEAMAALMKEFFEKCCLAKKMENILVDVLSRPMK